MKALIPFTLILLSALVHAQVPALEQAEAELQVKRAELEKPLEEWKAKYLEQLARLKAQVQSAGDLDQLVLINREIEEGNVEIPANYATFKRLQNVYNQRSAAIERDSLGKHRQLLLGYRQQLMDHLNG